MSLISTDKASSNSTKKPLNVAAKTGKTVEKKEAAQEDMKRRSEGLKGPILAELADENPYVSDESYELLKFHGSYQGYDRDSATARKKQGLEKEWEFMLRMKCPSGKLSAEQYLALDTIAENYADGTLRITTRQTFQFHCIIKENLKKHVAAINELMLTTLGGCGDVVRNVMSTPAPIKDAIHQQIADDAMKVAEFTYPKTTGYDEIWLDKEGQVKQGEPLYGDTYLTRKFKIGIALPEDNSIDVMTNDLAIIPVYEGETLTGYTFAVGGGLGMNHNKPATYPRLASPLAFVPKDDLLKGVAAAVKLNRDHCDRTNRKHARLKYLVEEKGLEWTKATFDDFIGYETQAPTELGEFHVRDHMGWHEQGDGKLYLGVYVDAGRIGDAGPSKYRTGLRTIIERFNTPLVLTPDQNIILCDIAPSDKEAIEALLSEYHIDTRESMTDLRRFFLSCVALPTCGKALAEAERVHNPMIDIIQDVMTKHGVSEDRIAIRLTGCPNGCARPYVGDVGIVGRTPDHYSIFIGGDFEGTRLNTKILDRVPYDHLADIFDILFEKYVAHRTSKSEGFGDFAQRFGPRTLAEEIESRLSETYKWAKAA